MAIPSDGVYATRSPASEKVRRAAATHTTFTSGEIAKICGVAPKTASRWFDTGEFPAGYRIPGAKDRRVPREDFVAFCVRNKIVRALELLQPKSRIKVVVAGGSPPLTQVLQKLVTNDLLDVTLCQDAFDLAKAVFAPPVPDLLVCDRLIERSAVRKAVAALKAGRVRGSESHTVVVLDELVDSPDKELPEDEVTQGSVSVVMEAITQFLKPGTIQLYKVA